MAFERLKQVFKKSALFKFASFSFIAGIASIPVPIFFSILWPLTISLLGVSLLAGVSYGLMRCSKPPVSRMTILRQATNFFSSNRNKGQIRQARIPIDELKKENREKKAQLSALGQQFSANAQQISVLNQQVSILDQQVSVLDRQVSFLAQRVSARGQQLLARNQKIDLLLSDCKEMEKRMAILESKNGTAVSLSIHSSVTFQPAPLLPMSAGAVSIVTPIQPMSKM